MKTSPRRATCAIYDFAADDRATRREAEAHVGSLAARFFRCAPRVAGALLVLATAAAGQAGPITGDVIFGEFSNPILQGSVVDPTPPDTGAYNNSSTAFVEIANSTNGTLDGTPPGQQFGSAILWGDNPGSSALIFGGRPIPVDPSKPFDLGAVEFFNGTSALNSLIFGATISFFEGQPVPGGLTGAIPLGSSTISITTTNNNGNLLHDADYVAFGGIANKSLNAFEGAGVTAELYGTITGDPQLTLTNIVLDPNQSKNGFIGNGQPVETPEPTTALLLGTGLLSLLGWRRRHGSLRPVGG